jgi:hypothetical protein
VRQQHHMNLPTQWRKFISILSILWAVNFTLYLFVHPGPLMGLTLPAHALVTPLLIGEYASNLKRFILIRQTRDYEYVEFFLYVNTVPVNFLTVSICFQKPASLFFPLGI